MYDYGARFYMPDIGRFGTIDPRSQYTHEAYSYVWNNPVLFNDPTGMEGEDPKKKEARERTIEPVVITILRPIDVKPKEIDLSSSGAALGTVTFVGSRSENPWGWAAAALAALSTKLFVDEINYPISGVHIDNITLDPSNPSGIVQKLSGDEFNLDVEDINGVTVPIDDSGYKKPTDFLAFSKVARGNQRDTGLIGWSDEDIATELAGLKGNLSKEQKARTTRNKQKKSGEKGTGTGRR